MSKENVEKLLKLGLKNDPIWSENGTFVSSRIYLFSPCIMLRNFENEQKSLDLGLFKEKLKPKCKLGPQNILATLHKNY